MTKCKLPHCSNEATKSGFCSQKCRNTYNRKLKEYKNKLYLISFKGGKCEKCGYNKNLSALDFHHKDETNKEFTLGENRRASIEKQITEVEKCVLLCSNCHREEHAIRDIYDFWINEANDCFDAEKILMGNRKIQWPPQEQIVELLWKIPMKEVSKKLGVSDFSLVEYVKKNNIEKPPLGFWQKLDPSSVAKKKVSHNTCDNCDKPISTGSKMCKSCTTKERNNFKIDWPSDETMKELVWKFPRTKLSEMLGVSDRAISKRLQKRNIPQPPRGYWAKVQAGKLP